MPILTGLQGFRWPEAEMDAKCVVQEPATGIGTGYLRRVDRHHRVVPDPQCTCGIYAGADELLDARDPLPPRSIPFVTGFVALTGRVLQDGSILRAQHATIIGPLRLTVGRRPRWHRLAPGATRSLSPRITIDRGTYRTVWTGRQVGEQAEGWLEATATALQSRYGVAVVLPTA